MLGCVHMNRQFVGLLLSTSTCIATAVGGSVIAACGSTNSGSGSGGSGSAASGSSESQTASGSAGTGGGTSGAAGSSGSGAGGPTCPMNNSSLLIDDMNTAGTDGPGTGGYWFTYSDRTNPYSEPPIYLTPMPPGSIIPVEGASFRPNATGPGSISNARECTGMGESNWGAGFGFDFVDTKPDGGNNVPFWGCDGGGPSVWNDNPDGGTGIPLPFDASSHKGVAFWAKSNTGASVSVEIKFSEKRTNPWAGVCNACATSSVNPMAQCSDDYLKIITVTGDWALYTIRFSDLATQNFTKIDLAAGGFDASTFYSLHFQFHTRLTPLPPFDVAVACVQFVDD